MWYLSIDNDANWSNEWMNEWPMQTIKKNAKAPVVVAAFLHTLTIGQFNSFQLTRISENESGWGRETAMGVLLIVPILSCASVLCNVQMKEHANLNRIIFTQEKNTNDNTNMSFAVAFIVHLIVQIKSYWFLFFCSADRMRAHQAVERASMCCENEKNIKIVHFRHSSQWMKNLFTKINKHWTHVWNSYHRYLPSKLSN